MKVGGEVLDKAKRPINEQGEKIFDDILPVISATECTGLVQSAPTTSEEVESFNNIYDIPLSENDGSEDVKKKKD